MSLGSEFIHYRKLEKPFLRPLILTYIIQHSVSEQPCWGEEGGGGRLLNEICAITLFLTGKERLKWLGAHKNTTR